MLIFDFTILFRGIILFLNTIETKCLIYHLNGRNFYFYEFFDIKFEEAVL